MQTAYEESEEVCAHLHRTLTHVRAELAEREEQVEVLERSVAFREEADAEVKPLLLLHILGVKVSRFQGFKVLRCQREKKNNVPSALSHSSQPREKTSEKTLENVFFSYSFRKYLKNAFCKYRTLSHFHVPFLIPYFSFFFVFLSERKQRPCVRAVPTTRFTAGSLQRAGVQRSSGSSGRLVSNDKGTNGTVKGRPGATAGSQGKTTEPDRGAGTGGSSPHEEAGGGEGAEGAGGDGCDEAGAAVEECAEKGGGVEGEGGGGEGDDGVHAETGSTGRERERGKYGKEMEKNGCDHTFRLHVWLLGNCLGRRIGD